MNVPYRLEVEADKHAAGAAQNSRAVRGSEMDRSYRVRLLDDSLGGKR